MVVQPVRQWASLASGLAGQGDVLIGYSTGAFLLMAEPELAATFERRILLAPFLDFKAESGMGGRTRLAQLKYLLRWLARDPSAALADFYKRAGLGLQPPLELPVSPIDLQWGIERLLHDAQRADALRPFDAHVGSEDSLIDASRLRELAPGVRIHPGLGHDLEDLLKAMVKEGLV